MKVALRVHRCVDGKPRRNVAPDPARLCMKVAPSSRPTGHPSGRPLPPCRRELTFVDARIGVLDACSLCTRSRAGSNVSCDACPAGALHRRHAHHAARVHALDRFRTPGALAAPHLSRSGDAPRSCVVDRDRSFEFARVLLARSHTLARSAHTLRSPARTFVPACIAAAARVALRRPWRLCSSCRGRSMPTGCR
jgi:hypothetical protein